MHTPGKLNYGPQMGAKSPQHAPMAKKMESKSEAEPHEMQGDEHDERMKGALKDAHAATGKAHTFTMHNEDGSDEKSHHITIEGTIEGEGKGDNDEDDWGDGAA